MIRRPGAKADGVGVGSATGPGAPHRGLAFALAGVTARLPMSSAWGPAKRLAPPLLADSAALTQLQPRARSPGIPPGNFEVARPATAVESVTARRRCLHRGYNE
ncbi:hypothetical protein MTO96_009750 [Rhipicephalus appendiculatus]